MTNSSSSETGDAASNAAAEPETASNELKKKELIDLVVARSGIKKKDAKPVIEAMLAVLGDAVAEGQELNLPPFGKLRINRTVEKPNGRITICKLRQSANAPGGTTPLAEAAQDG